MKEKAMMVIVMISISIVSALLLAAVNEASYDVIEKNREFQFKKGVLNALDIRAEESEIDQIYADRIEVMTIAEGKLYLSRQGGKVDAVAFTLKGAGFWGPISLVIGVDAEYLEIIGMEVLEQEETPGLGARIEEKDFIEQFLDKEIAKPIVVQIKGARPGPNDVEAITGATISSKAMEKIINEGSRPYIVAIERLKEGS